MLQGQFNCLVIFGLGSVVWMTLILNAPAYSGILGNSFLYQLCINNLFGLVLFQHDSSPVHKASSIKKWVSQFHVDEHDLNPIQHI